MKIFTISLLILCFSVYVYGQSGCEATLKNSLELKGFKLGMTIEQAEKIIGTKITPQPKDTEYSYREKVESTSHDSKNISLDRTEMKGVETKDFLPDGSVIKTFKVKIGETIFRWFKNDGSQNSLSGIESLTLTFFNGKMSEIDVQYDNTVKWKDLSEFLDVVSEKLTLNRKQWESFAKVDFYFFYKCELFALSASTFAEIFSLSLRDPKVSETANKLAEQEYFKAQEKQKQKEINDKATFKP